MQAHFTELLMRDMAKVDFPPDRIFSQTVSGRPKSEVLETLEQRHSDASAYIFVEDKFSTLKKVAQVGLAYICTRLHTSTAGNFGAVHSA